MGVALLLFQVSRQTANRSARATLWEVARAALMEKFSPKG